MSASNLVTFDPTVPDAASQYQDTETWPEALDGAAFYGLAGEIVRAIEPHTESDSAALLIQLLTGFGVACGRNPYFAVERDRHGLNLFAVVVGRTARARKGTSLGWVESLIKGADPSMVDRMATGLSSGEGLIAAVRDPLHKPKAVKDGAGNPTGAVELETVDEGVSDKRLLVTEGEFAQVLKVMARAGNSLSPIMRNAWDGKTLATITRNNPLRATGPHIGVIGHIVRDELNRHLDSTEAANGFANRVLWVCAKRSKHLAEGGALDDGQLEPLVGKLRRAVEFAKSNGCEIVRNAEARARWIKLYPDLTRDEPGLAAALTARGEAMVTRLSAIYATLDCSHAITPEHQRAALAVWGYAEESVKCIFGDRFGDPIADTLASALRSAGAGGMTRTEISNLLGRHTPSTSIERALTQLRLRGRATMAREGSGGAPIERWHGVVQIGRGLNSLNSQGGRQ